jgi:hypothetical protein
VGEVLNQTQGKNEDVLQTDALDFLGIFATDVDLTFLHDVSQSLSIVGILSHRFAKIPGLTSPIINDKG